jgi:hypothetical protein
VSSSGKKEGNGTLLTGSQIQAREAHQRGSRGSSRELQADELVAITNPQPRDHVLSSRRPRLILRTTANTTLVTRRLLLLLILLSHTHLRAHSRHSALLSTMTAFQHSSELDSACTIRWFSLVLFACGYSQWMQRFLDMAYIFTLACNTSLGYVLHFAIWRDRESHTLQCIILYCYTAAYVWDVWWAEIDFALCSSCLSAKKCLHAINFAGLW